MGAKFWKRLSHEQAHWSRGARFVAGVDEAGRGPLAGPVVAGAVLFPCAWLQSGLPRCLRGLNDSKQLTEEERERFFAALTSLPEVRWVVAQVEADLIDQINILQATHRAMRHALQRLEPEVDHVLLDGLPVEPLRYPQTALVKGDARSYTIAAASVVAKVTRDRLMKDYDQRFPGYGFAEHKGYGTPEHLEAIQRLGPCPIHRRSFSPFRPVELELFAAD
jgi:ribonuclease HII